MTTLPFHDDDLLAGEYALGMLEGQDRLRFEQRLESDRALQISLSRWQERFAPLDRTAETIEPSAGMWARIEAGLTEAPHRIQPMKSRGSRFSQWWGDLFVWRSLAFASLTAVAACLVAITMMADNARRQPTMVAVLMTQTNIAAAVVNTYADGRVELLPLQDISVPEGRALEIWTLWDKNVGPRSVGLIDSARSTTLRLDNLPIGRDQLFEITVEPASGSPTQRPTGPIVAKGLTAVRL